MSRNNRRPIEAETYQNIAVPTDGSEGANHAADHGLMLAEKLDATVHIVSVIESAGSAKRDQLRTDPEELATEAVDAVREQARYRDIETEAARLSGTPKEALLNYIEEYDMDLVVMGTHGRTGLGNVVFGSIAENIVRNASAPVLTVKPPQWED